MHKHTQTQVRKWDASTLCSRWHFFFTLWALDVCVSFRMWINLRCHPVHTPCIQYNGSQMSYGGISFSLFHSFIFHSWLMHAFSQMCLHLYIHMTQNWATRHIREIIKKRSTKDENNKKNVELECEPQTWIRHPTNEETKRVWENHPKPQIKIHF